MNLSRPEQVMTIIRRKPERDSWTSRQLSEATGFDMKVVSTIVSALKKTGRLVSNGNGYALSANEATKLLNATDPRDPRQVQPRAARALPAGPCPQSDALLRLMRSTGGAKSCRQWAAIWAERDSATQQMLDKLVDRGLIGHMNGMYRA